MLTIRAISLNGQAISQPLEAEFDELGGSIGRADGNVLVLPDPERHISRTQATIAFRQGRYLIRDCGSTLPVVLNGRALGKGAEAALAGGDRLQIGGYALQALETGPAQRAQAPAAAPCDDPLAMFTPPDADPFAIGPPRRPDDGAFDPFSAKAARPQPAAPRIPDDFDLGPGSTPNIDQLFGLDQAATADPLAAGAPLGDPRVAGTPPMSQDPLVALGAVPAPRAPPPAQRDDAMEIRAAYIPPTATFGAPARADNTMDTWNAAPAGAASRGEIRTVFVPEPALGDAAPRHTADKGAQSGRADAGAAPAPGPLDAASAELLRAFLAGAGVPELDLRAPLTPASMNAIGQLLRVATQGMLDLLQARALIKREMHAEVTIIVPRENNPLKFSPNVEVALAHLLAPRAPGFMGPVAAVKDACDDLRAHQFGFMAGMRAALDGVLHRFDPAQLEHRLSEQNVLDTLLPMHRKARLWALFGELYGELTREAQDDFDKLFGKEFVRAYQAQLDRLERDASAGR
jgi:type VI secretion system FHA domain protein